MTSPLAHPTFRRLFAAQAIALIGTGLSTVALALWPTIWPASGRAACWEPHWR